SLRGELERVKEEARTTQEGLEALVERLEDGIKERDRELSLAAEERARLDGEIAARDQRIADVEADLSEEQTSRAMDVSARDERIEALELQVATLKEEGQKSDKAHKHKEAELQAALDEARAIGEELDADLAKTRAKLAE